MTTWKPTRGGWLGSNEASPRFVGRAIRNNIGEHMSKPDLAKEKIAYLKPWLGMVFAVGVTLIGWLLSNFRSAHWLLVLIRDFSPACSFFKTGVSETGLASAKSSSLYFS